MGCKGGYERFCCYSCELVLSPSLVVCNEQCREYTFSFCWMYCV